MQKGIPDVVKILEDPITRVQVPETTALDAYYKDATFWSIHSKQFYDALPEERLRAIPRAFQSAQKSPPVCYRCLRLMYEIPSIPRKKGTAEAVAEATAKKEAAYADYAKKVDKANEWAKAQRPKNKYPPIKDKKPAQLPPAQNQMAQTVLGGPKTKASKSAKDMAAAFGHRPSRRRRDLLKQWSHARNQNNTDNNTDGYLFSIFQTDLLTLAPIRGFWRLRLNQIPSDIDTLQIKGVYLELDTTAIPDPTAAKTVNVLLMDVVIPTWATTAWKTHPLLELRVRFTDITGATKKNNAFIVKNFGLWAYAK
eukprot:tig00001033_g6510.t1